MRISDWSSDVCSSDLLNLLSNAIKFTPDGGGVMVEARLERAGDLSLIVRDSGIGMSADDIVVVLQPFGQVESAHTRSHDGTGLGLPITKSLAEMHGGSMTVESEVGKGSVITVRFPAARVGRSAEHTSALQSPMRISYAVFCF